MQYIFSEEEYNALQSRIQSFESINKEILHDLVDAESRLSAIMKEPKYILQNGMAIPKLGAYIQFARATSVREVAQFRCFEAFINGDAVWFPICLLKSTKFYKSLEKIKNIKLHTTDDFEGALCNTTIKCVPNKINRREFIAIG
jgi:hypothetical protein